VTETTAQEKEVRYITENDAGYKVAFVDGIVGAVGGTGGRMAFYVDIPQCETGPIPFGQPQVPEIYTNSIKRVFLIDIRMSTENWKSIAKLMTDQISVYEKMIQSGSVAKPGEITQSYHQ